MLPALHTRRPALLLAAALAVLLAGCGVESSQPAPAITTDEQWGHLESEPDKAQQARAGEGAQVPGNPAV
jgi:hypothetical protein